MTAEQFKKENHLRSCGKCCATCKHGRDLLDDGIHQCVHSDLKDERTGLYTDAAHVCDKWEGRDGFNMRPVAAQAAMKKESELLEMLRD